MIKSQKTTDANSVWNLMLKCAKLQQQEYYELLPEYTKYEKREYKYLKQNIGFALFGPPSDITEENNTVDNPCQTDIIDKMHYKPMFQKVIDKIYDKVYEFGDGAVQKECIYFGIIFNITFCTKDNCIKAVLSDSKIENKQDNSKKSEIDSKKENKQDNSKKSEIDSKKENKQDNSKKSEIDSKKENKQDNSKSETNSKEEKEQNNSEESKMDFQSTPIFKIKRIIINNDPKVGKDKSYTCEEWYIDAWARVYKSWAGYKENNVLPPCTMVIPKNGFYQPDPNYVMTEEYSTVWLEVLESPQCSIASTVVKIVDTTASVVGAASLALGVAAMFTPAAPLVIGAIATGAASGAWSTSRSVHNLVDRNAHEQSINITDRDALCSWLSIAGGVLSAAATGGNFIFMQAIKNGSNINTFMKFAYNTLLVGNLGVNGCGVAYNAYCMYEKYQQGDKITVYDVLSVGTHILFFGNAVMNFQFAGDLIESTQGRILDDYRATLRSKRLRKAFNRARRDAAANNSDSVAQNAEVIRYINKKTELRLQNNLQKNSKNNSQSTTKNNSQSTSKSNSQNNSQDNSNNNSGDNSQSASKNNSQSNVKNNSGDNSQSTSKNNSQSNIKNTSKNSSQNSSKSTSQNNSQSNSKNNSGDNSQSTSKNNSQSNSENISKNNSGDNSQSAPKNSSQNNLKNNSGDNSQNTTKNNSQSNLKNTSKNSSQNSSKSTSQNNSQSNSKNNSGDNSQSTSKNNSQSNSENISKNNSGDNSQSAPKNSSQNNLKNNSGDNSQNTTKNNSQSNLKNTSKNSSQNSSKSTSQNNSQSNSKNNSGDNSQSTSKNNSQSASENNSQSTSKSNSENNSQKKSSGNSFTPKSIVSFEKGKIIINGIIMLDPLKFVTILLASEKRCTKKGALTNQEDKDSEVLLLKLKSLLIRLLTEICSRNDNKIAKVPDISNFDGICKDMVYMKDAGIILPCVLEIAVTLVQYFGGIEVIDKAVYFVWNYVKESLIRVCYTVSSFITNPKIQEKISSTVSALFEHMSYTVQELSPAFGVYIKAIN